MPRRVLEGPHRIPNCKKRGVVPYRFRQISKSIERPHPCRRPRVLAFCVMAVSLLFTLAVTAANLRLTYVTDSYGARQLVVSTDADSDPARVMSLSGMEAEEGDHVYYTAFSGSLASLNIERAFTVTIRPTTRSIR